jgi:hypothetical protein
MKVAVPTTPTVQVKHVEERSEVVVICGVA